MKKLIQLSDEMWAAIDAARGDTPRNPWIERTLRKIRAVRNGAKQAGVTLPHRAKEGRGKYRRKT